MLTDSLAKTHPQKRLNDDCGVQEERPVAPFLPPIPNRRFVITSNYDFKTEKCLIDLQNSVFEAIFNDLALTLERF